MSDLVSELERLEDGAIDTYRGGVLLLTAWTLQAAVLYACRCGSFGQRPRNKNRWCERSFASASGRATQTRCCYEHPDGSSRVTITQ